MEFYDSLLDVLSVTLEGLDALTNNEHTAVNEMYSLLTGNDSTYRDDFENLIYNFNLDGISSVQDIMILLICSFAYLLNNYDYHIGLNESISQDVMTKIDYLNASELLKLFKNDKALATFLISDFVTFINRPYIFQNKSKALVVSQGKTRMLLHMNPYFFLLLGDFIPNDKYISSENVIQDFYNLYEISLEKSYNDEDGSRELFDSNEEFIANVFADSIKDFYVESSKVSDFVRYIISNVYENMVVNNDQLSEEEKELKQYIETTNILELVNLFLNNYDFMLLIVDCFFMFNDTIVENDLFDRRESFKKHGDINILKKLNPYFMEEEIVFKNLKRNR